MKALKLKFSFIHQVTKKASATVHCYYFSPADGWICCGHQSYSADNANPDIDEAIYSYEAKKGEPFPVLKRIEEWDKNSREPAKSRLRYEIELSEFHHSSVPFPDSDFKLSAFGLPEPEGLKQPAPPPRTWLWLIVAAVGAALLAILFAWLKRRRASSRVKANLATPSTGSS